MLKINSKMQIVDIDTREVYGNIFRSSEESLYFRKKWYMRELSDNEQEQIDNILKEVNNEY